MEKVKEPLVRNSRGVTLVELLASIALLSLVVTLVMSVFMVGQNAFERQTSKADMQDAVTLAMKDITKEVRSSSLVTVNSTNNLKADTIEYKFTADGKLLKNGRTLVVNIDNIEFFKDIDSVTINMENIDPDISVKSKIYIRK